MSNQLQGLKKFIEGEKPSRHYFLYHQRPIVQRLLYIEAEIEEFMARYGNHHEIEWGISTQHGRAVISCTWIDGEGKPRRELNKQPWAKEESRSQAEELIDLIDRLQGTKYVITHLEGHWFEIQQETV